MYNWIPFVSVGAVSYLCGGKSSSSFSDFFLVGVLGFWIGFCTGACFIALILSNRLRVAIYQFALHLAPVPVRPTFLVEELRASPPAGRRRVAGYLNA
jgi:hypothetical protein